MSESEPSESICFIDTNIWLYAFGKVLFTQYS
jgi:predicted nucleic acid-binding protein